MKRIFIVFALIITCLLNSLLGYTPAITYADDIVYTNVLEDLQLDKNFNKNDFVLKSDDYSLQVIQVAESVNNELFVYVYQPSANVKASSINISTVIGDDPDYNNYKLDFINSNGVFYKYKVNNFELKTNEVRRYEISSIYRPFNNILDNKPTDDNTINEIAFKVGKTWTAQTIENKVVYDCIEIDTIQVTDKHTGFIRYYDGFKFYQQSCDSHYIAFTTDKQIDRLLSAEVSYTSTRVVETITLLGTDKSYGEPKKNKVVLNYDDVVSNPADGWFGDRHIWNRIEKASDFVLTEDLTTETKETLKNKQWILRFLETDYITMPTPNCNIFTQIEKGTILELTFETEGVIYNLGVVDNKQSGDLNPDNNYGWQWPTWLKVLVIVLGLIVLVILLTILWPVLKLIVKAIVWLITLPFRWMK